MAYEVFQRTAVRVEKPTLAVTPDGRIALNAAAFRIFKKAGVLSVLLLWDRANYKLALKAAPKADKNAYAISANRQSGTLAGKLFLGYIGWSAPKRILVDAVWNEKEKMLEVTVPPQYVGSAPKTGERIRKT